VTVGHQDSDEILFSSDTLHGENCIRMEIVIFSGNHNMFTSLSIYTSRQQMISVLMPLAYCVVCKRWNIGPCTYYTLDI